jgi:hypothetical protein
MARPCEVWNWKGPGAAKHQDLAHVLQITEETAARWESGTKKDRFRSTQEQPLHGLLPLEQVRKLLDMPPKQPRVFGLFIGIDNYEYLKDLENAVAGAQKLAARMKSHNSESNILETVPVELGGSTGLSGDNLQGAVIRLCNEMKKLEQKPEIAIFYFAGHGLHFESHDYMLASNFVDKESGDQFSFLQDHYILLCFFPSSLRNPVYQCPGEESEAARTPGPSEAAQTVQPKPKQTPRDVRICVYVCLF